MTKQKRGLGKGLSALIPDEISAIDISNKDYVLNLDINEIKPKTDQPRKFFEIGALSELEESIKMHGVVQPIVVRKMKNGYEIIAGERRWRACKNLNIKTIPCIEKVLNDREVMEISLIENLQREDLNEIEEGQAFKKLIKDFNITQEEIGDIVGKSRSYITNTMRLLKLYKPVQDMIVNKMISGGHGRSLLRLEKHSDQKLLADRIVEEKLSVRDIEKIVGAIIEDSNKKREKTKTVKIDKDPNIVYIENSLKDRFSTKVNIIKGKKKGKIEIEYYNEDDLMRIVDMLNKNVSRETL